MISGSLRDTSVTNSLASKNWINPWKKNYETCRLLLVDLVPPVNSLCPDQKPSINQNYTDAQQAPDLLQFIMSLIIRQLVAGVRRGGMKNFQDSTIYPSSSPSSAQVIFRNKILMSKYCLLDAASLITRHGHSSRDWRCHVRKLVGFTLLRRDQGGKHLIKLASRTRIIPNINI